MLGGLDALMKTVQEKYMRNDIPEFRPGDTVRVYVKVKEGDKERIQAFEGVVIRKRGGGTDATFTVRKVSYGIGIERTFPMHAPVIEKVEVLKRGIVRRARLYYLRERKGKAARIKEKKEWMTSK
ncbi:large subunit ribosomal protein L19 [Desulfurobacterium pacificum]|jgi:large subunit ribosomal protein L19|uniref:Large ribosomal subunit protein bL19 n=1 Tax=Desulfurobacterium pacificum TaxID=240166 RepID=A0ABY1NNB3_9BACT|nr:50S ribosomal protein L19 [Desulfurobacterium pacificum]SMP13954.1 large subunit ribosomal protein L19 [Desulfurobacterium pacificum]